MPLALFAATVFSEAMWQRCWASSDTKNLRKGAWVGAAITIVVVWFAGFTGLLTIWAENPALTYADDIILDRWNSTSMAMEPTAASQRPNYDLYMFQVLYDGKYPDVGKNASYGFVTEDEYSTNGLLVYPSIQNWMGVILVALAVGVPQHGYLDRLDVLRPHRFQTILPGERLARLIRPTVAVEPDCHPRLVHRSFFPLTRG